VDALSRKSLKTTAPERLSLVASCCGEECMQIRHFCDRLSDTSFSGDQDDIAEIHTALLAVRNALHGIRYVCEHEVKRTGL